MTNKTVVIKRKMLMYWKLFMPLLMGLTIGIAVSLIATPFSGEGCLDQFRAGKQSNGVNRAKREDPNLNFPFSEKQDGKEDDYEPHIKVFDDTNIIEVEKPKILRPRYAATELGIREKLFVAVLTSRQTVDTLGVAINKTFSPYVEKLVFFMESRRTALPEGMSIVSFDDQKPHLKPFHMFKYIGDHFLKGYDWFYFVTDDTYVRGEKIMDMARHLSVDMDIQIGKAVPVYHQERSRCQLGAGLYLSWNMMNSILDSLDWCMVQASSDNPSDNVGRCIQHATGKSCTESVNGFVYNHFSSGILNTDDELERAKENVKFQQALTVNKIGNENMMYKIHRYFCDLEINATKVEIEKLKEDMLAMSPKAPPEYRDLSWPLGVDAPSEPVTKFDVIRWDYFTEKHVLLDNDFNNQRELVGVHKEDISDVIKVSVQKLNEKYGNIFTYSHLINGYKRFDPVRGMEYKMDLGLKFKSTGQEIMKSVKLLRPLGKVEIVPMPYVTENTRVNLILSATAEDEESVMAFLDNYAKTCLDTGDNSNLFLVFIENNDPQKAKEDPFAQVKSMISYYESKYLNGARISWTNYVGNSPTPFDIFDIVSKKFPPEAMFFVCTLGMELNIEFLNRVRMNTIQEWQVFFPIGFFEYKPNLIYSEKPYPATVELNRNVGHFDSHSYVHGSFYNSDYICARKRMRNSGGTINTYDLYDMFIKFNTLHIFRATDPSLIQRYRPVECDPLMDEDTYQECLASRATALASRSQLALLIFEHQQKNSPDKEGA